MDEVLAGFVRVGAVSTESETEFHSRSKEHLLPFLQSLYRERVLPSNSIASRSSAVLA